MGSKAYELADPQFKGKITRQHFGGCYVPEVRERNKKSHPRIGWGQEDEVKKRGFFLQERVTGLNGQPTEELEDYLVGGAHATIVPDKFSPDNDVYYGEEDE